MHPPSRIVAVTLVVSLLLQTATTAVVRHPPDTQPAGVRYAHAFLTEQALALPLLAPLHSRPLIDVVASLRNFTSGFAVVHDERVNSVRSGWLLGEPDWFAWSLAAVLSAVALATAFGPSLRGSAIEKAAALLAELGDVSQLELTVSERKVVRELQNGERQTLKIAENLDISGTRIHQIAARLVKKLERERTRREREELIVGVQGLPVSALGFKPPIPKLLQNAGIETADALLDRSDVELLHVPGIGRGRLARIKEQLWRDERQLLRSSKPPQTKPEPPPADRAADLLGDADVAALPLEALGLPARTTKLLHGNGIATVAALLEKSQLDLLLIPQLGRGRLSKIEERLWKLARRTLRDAPPPHEPMPPSGGTLGLFLPVGVALSGSHPFEPSNGLGALGALLAFYVIGAQMLRHRLPYRPVNTLLRAA